MNTGLVHCSFVIFQRIRASISKESCSFVNFRGGGDPDSLPPPPLDPRMYVLAVFFRTILTEYYISSTCFQVINLYDSF